MMPDGRVGTGCLLAAAAAEAEFCADEAAADATDEPPDEAALAAAAACRGTEGCLLSICQRWIGDPGCRSRTRQDVSSLKAVSVCRASGLLGSTLHNEP